MDLREKIARVLIDQGFEGFEEAYPMADAILAIPEIKDALEISGKFPENDFRDYLLRRGRWNGVASEAGYV